MKYIFKVILFIFCVVPLSTFAQGEYLEGTINGSLKIQMYLEFVGEETLASGAKRTIYEGWYYYESQGANNKITLSGMYFSTQFYLTEEVNEQVTGYFNLFPADETYQGEWENPDGKIYPVVLKPKQ